METNSKEPKRVVIPLKPILEPLIEGSLKKDLLDDEAICPVCNGFAIAIRDAPYTTDKTPPVKMYKRESIVMQNCPNCYNGIVKRCKYCGEYIKRGWLKHDCEQQQAEDRKERIRKEAEDLANAPVAPQEVLDKCAGYFSDSYSDGYFTEWEQFFDEWYDNENEHPIETRPEYVWIADAIGFSIDATSICEQATEDLYDDAMQYISDKDIERLQKFLDEWCGSTGVGYTLQQSKKYKARIPWEEYDRMYGDAE